MTALVQFVVWVNGLQPERVLNSGMRLECAVANM
jgi:hypothetical protein